MKEHPIPFNGAMVRAILEGKKGSTRRLVAAPPVDGWGFDGEYGRITSSHKHKGKFGAFVRRGVGTDFPEVDIIPSPYGAPGDRLWVRENWAADAQVDSIAPRDLSQGEPICYPADGSIRQTGCALISKGKGRPSIHMPRWASRLLLEVTSVCVERLQDISDSQAIAEGVIRAGSGWRGYEEGPWFASPIGAFGSLWEQINGAGSWAANPWVWAIGFEGVAQEAANHA